MNDDLDIAFERAADAVIAGDETTLRDMIAADGELVRRRSDRPNHATLLHYVSANGIEDERQKTPRNIIDIAQILLSAGADVNAESDSYAGQATTLMLTATSIHPQQAGVQLDLLQLLLNHGATLRDADVTACLRNGRGAAAEFLARSGAALDLESAAGVGRLDVVKTFVDTATQKQKTDGFAWACQFGRTDDAEFLLAHGVGVNDRLPHHGQTGLHWAAFGGHTETAGLLLQHGAALELVDNQYGGTPLDWALHAAGQDGAASKYNVAALLVKAGAQVGPQRLSNVNDPQMLAILSA